eukprot:gene25058-biopygen4466
MPGKQKSRKQNGSVPERCAFCFLLSGECLGSQDSGAGVARAWRGRGAGYRLLFGLGGVGVARTWRGRGAGMSCDPWEAEKQKAQWVIAGTLCFLLSAFWGIPEKQTAESSRAESTTTGLVRFCVLLLQFSRVKDRTQKAQCVAHVCRCAFCLSVWKSTMKSRKQGLLHVQGTARGAGHRSGRTPLGAPGACPRPGPRPSLSQRHLQRTERTRRRGRAAPPWGNRACPRHARTTPSHKWLTARATPAPCPHQYPVPPLHDQRRGHHREAAQQRRSDEPRRRRVRPRTLVEQREKSHCPRPARARFCEFYLTSRVPVRASLRFSQTGGRTRRQMRPAHPPFPPFSTARDAPGRGETLPHRVTSFLPPQAEDEQEGAHRGEPHHDALAPGVRLARLPKEDAEPDVGLQRRRDVGAGRTGTRGPGTYMLFLTLARRRECTIHDYNLFFGSFRPTHRPRFLRFYSPHSCGGARPLRENCFKGTYPATGIWGIQCMGECKTTIPGNRVRSQRPAPRRGARRKYLPITSLSGGRLAGTNKTVPSCMAHSLYTPTAGFTTFFFCYGRRPQQ